MVIWYYSMWGVLVVVGIVIIVQEWNGRVCI